MRKVMIVEDEELILQGIKNIVHWNELELQLFHMAHSGQEALEMWKKEPVDIIITDIEMPDEWPGAPEKNPQRRGTCQVYYTYRV